MSLQSPRFSKNTRLRSASQNAPPLRKGESGEAVRILQRALLDLGYPMPLSTGRSGVPDGIFGNETAHAVSQYQQDFGLAVDAIVGSETMSSLDILFREDDPVLGVLREIVNRGTRLLHQTDASRASGAREMDRLCGGLGRMLHGSPDDSARIIQIANRLIIDSNKRYS